MPDFNMLPPISSGSQQAQAPQSLLQMAQDAMGQDVAPSAPPGGWAPAWVTEQLNAWNRDAPAGQKSSDIGFGRGTGSLVPYLNPDNWGPPPPPGSGSGSVGSGWFPAFSGLGSDPNEKFWTMKSYMSQLPGGGGSTNDESPNTRNWRLLEGAAPGQNTGPGGTPLEPGDFMYLGHPISVDKIRTDLARNSVPAAGGEGTGTPGGIIHHTDLFGPAGTAWNTAGQVGLPGQLDPYWTSWGVGGP